MVSTCSSVSVTMNTNDAHANDANANVADSNNTNANDAYPADKANSNANTNRDDNLLDKVDPFPVLSCKERSRFIEIQRIIIRTLISEFWLERAVHYITFNPPFGIVYKGARVDILELDLLIYEIIFALERRELYISYVRNFPRDSFTRVCKHRYNILEGPSDDDDDDNNNDNDNDRKDDGDGGKDSKSPDVLKKVGDKAPPDTNTTLPLPTTELARQAEDLQAHLSVFPNGHRGPSEDRLLAEMELELLKRGTE
jgi:hypothetical protein